MSCRHGIHMVCQLCLLAMLQFISYLCCVNEGDSLIHNRLICREVVFPVIVTPVALIDAHTTIKANACSCVMLSRREMCANQQKVTTSRRCYSSPLNTCKLLGTDTNICA